MLRAVSSIYFESQAFELLTTTRRDVFKLFRTTSTTPAAYQTVLTSGSSSSDGAHRAGGAPPGAPPPPAPPPPPPPRARQAWTVAAAALAVTASIGGVYFYRKINDEEKNSSSEDKGAEAGAQAASAEAEAPPYPALAAQFPAHVQYLLVGGGTASFAAMRAIRSARPDAQVLLVGDERALPYMRPPLSKELWREPDLARAAADLDALTFRQWNGKRRSVLYEPNAFYAPVERLAAGEGGACAARGWRVTRLDPARREAALEAAGQTATVRYDRVLLATGLRPRRAEALRAARATGRVLPLRSAADAARLAALLDRPDVTRVAIVGGGFLASELSASLAERLRGTGATVTQLFREAAPLAGVLPLYLAREAARRLRRAGVALRPGCEVAASRALRAGDAPAVRLELAGGGELDADLVVECVGSSADTALAEAAGLETHAALGGVLVNGELQARSGVYAAGDAACFYDAALGRRRVEHHDHAVVSGRLAGENMAGVAPPRVYDHQSMFWSDLGPDLGYEAIGIVDSRLPTVGVFSAAAVADAEAEGALAQGAATGAEEAASGLALVKASGEGAGDAAGDAGVAGDAACARQYERGVVFYLRDKRVVGVLLWNLFNRMHVARQVLRRGEFEDLFEVAKLFSLHEDE